MMDGVGWLVRVRNNRTLRYRTAARGSSNQKFVGFCCANRRVAGTAAAVNLLNFWPSSKQHPAEPELGLESTEEKKEKTLTAFVI